MLKIFQGRLQQYVNCKLPDVQAGLRKGKRIRNRTANIHWVIEKSRDSRKISSCSSLTMPQHLTVWITTNWKILQEMGITDHLTCLLKICIQVKKQQLELNVEQQIGSKSGKKYVKAVHCHLAYLTLM